ncbi:MAG: hypothetical protein LBT46_15000 [Planctomycetaceae bacterium]|jgi:hypothetical protein|nr:hypothetical protein [Planctomycetaceae bacterium]
MIACRQYNRRDFVFKTVGRVAAILRQNADVLDGVKRPAEAENFDKLAEEEYNSRDKRKKDWDDLSYDYRKQLRYDAVKRWEKENPDKDAYRQLKGAIFLPY